MSEQQSNLNKKENFYLSKDELDYIYEVMRNNSLKKSEALKKILKEHKASSYLDKEDIHKKIADNIYKNFKDQVGKDINCAKITDKNVQILIEIFNAFLVNNAKECSKPITTDQFKSPILVMAEKEIENRINKNHKMAKGTLV
ncbi:hypothetical protein JGS6364_PCS1200421 (plasmid) [[Clostridium] sordellii]|uniref:Uncharacterized protein n=1 Tax=Paraclostridium sordellii TaxID=1505 RepID=A0ABP1XX96_PARSO|nr:hypothetical protein [Paeniclostridium sordellii]EPZ61870.1 hypothetical protein H477_5896 [[Clostridium] sordellii ATCC 9714] [Paeniclostridium sordellii ATCC 9714]CEJ75501.1 hypothetical protein ATCC9714PCS11_00421 (plasmid) [[Clostridium] sordellii] [Paeniclostridium sordellii]CEK32651.1 hypothetical protein JGS6364_PCS1200421 (plasmid) [[Clostridium] sordellii] [Paeniclostridium sordellii]CEN22458.1 Uncharacterised protein [[Clostridium] sordellii] [Paeniclostridium sordellii]CEN29737.1